MLGARAQLPVRNADLWLLSNIPALHGKPFRLESHPGIAFRNTSQRPDPEFDRPLLGMRTLHRAGVMVLIDYSTATVSLWTPGSWYETVSFGLRRAFSGFKTVPIRW